MSVEIDPTKPLSKEARAYLEERGADERIAAHDERFKAAAPAKDADEPADDYDKWTVAELKATADANKIEYASDAKKADLIEALRAYDAENPE